MSVVAKPCTKCRRMLALEHYHRSVSRADGRQNICKSCALAYQREGRRRGSELADAAKQVSVSLDRFNGSCMQLAAVASDVHDAAKSLLVVIQQVQGQMGGAR